LNIKNKTAPNNKIPEKKILLGLIYNPEFIKDEITSYLNINVNPKNQIIQTNPHSFQNNSSERFVYRNFSTPYKAVALATSPLLGIVRFIRYPKEIDQRELEFEIWCPIGSSIRFQRIALNQYAAIPKQAANKTHQ
jgi:hypothetical protein